MRLVVIVGWCCDWLPVGYFCIVFPIVCLIWFDCAVVRVVVRFCFALVVCFGFSCFTALVCCV